MPLGDLIDMSAPRNIDVGLLRAFVAVADTGRMTTAAKVVNRSQGAVSQQIHRLETLFQTELFHRDSAAIRLTQEGLRLMGRAHRLIALNDEVLSQMRESDFAGEVRLGVPHDIVGRLLPPILRNFRQEHPNVLITLVSDTTRAVCGYLRDRKVDLALTTDLERGDHDQFLLTDRLLWVGARDGQAFERRPLAVALGQESCAFRSVAIRALNKARIEWRAICQVGSLEPVFATLEADMAVAPFLSRTVPDRLAGIVNSKLPPLLRFFLNLRVPPSGVDAATSELARHIKEGILSRHTQS